MAETVYDGPMSRSDLERALVEVAKERDEAIEARRKIESKLESGYSFCHPESDCEGQRAWLKAASERDQLLEAIEAHRVVRVPRPEDFETIEDLALWIKQEDEKLYAIADRVRGEVGRGG